MPLNPLSIGEHTTDPAQLPDDFTNPDHLPPSYLCWSFRETGTDCRAAEFSRRAAEGRRMAHARTALDRAAQHYAFAATPDHALGALATLVETAHEFRETFRGISGGTASLTTKSGAL